MIFTTLSKATEGVCRVRASEPKEAVARLLAFGLFKSLTVLGIERVVDQNPHAVTLETV